MATKSRASTRVQTNATASTNPRRRTQRVVTAAVEFSAAPVPVKEKQVEPVMMQRRGKVSTHMTPNEPAAKTSPSGTVCVGCKHMPMDSIAMVAILLACVVALSVFLIDASSFL